MRAVLAPIRSTGYVKRVVRRSAPDNIVERGLSFGRNATERPAGCFSSRQPTGQYKQRLLKQPACYPKLKRAKAQTKIE